MMRAYTALLAGMVAAGPAFAAEKKLDIRWRGQSFFQVETSKGTRIIFDPHAIDAYGRVPVKADIVLISHEHDDHNQVGVVQMLDKQKKTNILHGLRPSKANPRRLEWNPIDKTIDDVHIRSVGVYHDAAQGMERGLTTVFVVEVDGMRIVHLGDLGHLLSKKQIAQIGPVDVLMIPVGGVYTINGSEAKEVVAQLKPRYYILPMHYGTPVFEDLLPPNEFLDEVPSKNIKRLPGNKLTVETDRKPPAEPTIVLLGWK
jgi:L-ascorbate metabolism protein UlaG (beta-lactamase superfamily)